MPCFTGNRDKAAGRDDCGLEARHYREQAMIAAGKGGTHDGTALHNSGDVLVEWRDDAHAAIASVLHQFVFWWHCQ